MRKCPQIRQISLYLDEELSPEEKLSLEEHLRTCPKCKAELEASRQIVSLLGGLKGEERSAEYWSYYESKLKERTREKTSKFSLAWGFRLAFIALAMLILSVGVASGNVSPVKLEVISNVPGASLYLDGELVGITPWESTVPMGMHSISIHKEGYKPWEHLVSFTLPTQRIEVRLPALAASEVPRNVRQFFYPSFSPKGDLLALLSSEVNFEEYSGELWLTDINGEKLERIALGLKCLPPVWSPNSQKLAFVQGNPGGDTLSIYNFALHSTLTSSPLLGISQVAWLDSDRVLVLAGNNSNLYLFQFIPLQMQTVASFPIERFTTSPDSKWLAYQSAQDGKIYLFSLVTMTSQPLIEESREYFDLAWSGSGNYLAAAAKEGLFLWDFTEGTQSFIEEGPCFEVTWHDDQLLFLKKVGNEESIMSFSPQTGELSTLFKDEYRKGALIIAPDGETYLFSSENTGFLRLLKDNLNSPGSPQPFFPGGTLVISSQPQAAEIYLNENYLGRTPSTMTLEPGTYNLVLKKESFRDWRAQLSISDGELKELNAVLTDPSLPSPVTFSLGQKVDAVISPDERFMAYVEETSGQSSLYLLDLKTGELSFLGSGKEPAWSPDSQKLYFTKGQALSDIWAHDLASSQENQLTFSGGARRASPSPNGEWLAYLESLDSDHFSLWLMNSDGGDQRLLREEKGTIFQFGWAPDKKIWYLTHKQGGDALCFCDLDGNHWELFSSPSLETPVWDEDGSTFAFISTSGSERKLFLYHYPELEFFYSKGMKSGDFPILLRGSKITWATKENEMLSLYSMDLETGALTKLPLERAQYLSIFAGKILIQAPWTGYSQVYILDLATP